MATEQHPPRDFIIGGELKVRRLGFGAMRITGQDIWGPPKDRNAAKALLHRVVALGLNFIDTADSYGPAVSEEIIAEALHPYPVGVVIATKGGLLRPRPEAWEPDGRPEHLRRALDASLKRLKVDYIDLYQLHSPDSRVPFEDSVGALADARKAGKIRHVGLSNVGVRQLNAARAIVPIASVQNRYSLSDRSSEKVLAACEDANIGFIPWYPLASGDLTRPGGSLERVAKELKATPSQVALAWLLKRSPVMLPIPGTGSMAHLEENARADAVTLTKAQFDLLAKA
jgi:aryl-alcohol dehydrogenase-like predicted oxidoreductase